MISPELLSTLSTSTVLSLSEVPLLPVWEHVEIPRTFTPRRFQFSSDHEFFEDGDVHRHLYLEDVLTGIGEVEERSKVSEFPCQAAGCSQVFDTLESYEHHYNTLHRNVCSTCKRSFPSARLLDIHILEWHDSLFLIMAEKSNMFQCLVEGCVEKFKTCGERKNHLIKTHLYPSDFRFDKPRKSKTSKIREGIAGLSMDVTTENSIVVESMEISELPSGDCGALRQSTTSTTYAKSRVPSTICFGHGSVRGFKHTKKKK
ncbi:zinc finger protein 511 [Hyperolius riggenbachi]|uniref:zinc finger protein 511 n=1 Tax=Hyperolius riggenbachi TaxID=752182 RepID=UPI0035A2B820